MLKGEAFGRGDWGGSTRKLLDMDEKDRLTNGRGGKEEAMV